MQFLYCYRNFILGVNNDDAGKYNPSEWVQNLINNVKSEGHKAHGVFSEMDVLKEYNGFIEWREAARYVCASRNVRVEHYGIANML